MERLEVEQHVVLNVQLGLLNTYLHWQLREPRTPLAMLSGSSLRLV